MVGYHLAKFSSHKHSDSRDEVISLSRDLARPSNKRVMWLFGQELIKLSYHPTISGGHRLSGSEDIMFLVCHMILT